MSRSTLDCLRVPTAAAITAAAAVLFAGMPATQAQWYDYDYYYDGAYYDDGVYDDDWYYDYYNYDETYTDAEVGEEGLSELEYEPDEGLHEEEWYDPSDWFDTERGISYEDGAEEYGEYEYEYEEGYDPGLGGDSDYDL